MKTIQTPPCMLCGGRDFVELTDEEYASVTAPDGPLIQIALKDRDADFREHIMTGTHSKCWDKMFPEEDES